LSAANGQITALPGLLPSILNIAVDRKDLLHGNPEREWPTNRDLLRVPVADLRHTLSGGSQPANGGACGQRGDFAHAIALDASGGVRSGH
jgi:hypothetical protein